MLVKKGNWNQKRQPRGNKFFQPSVYTNAKNGFSFGIQKVTASCEKARKERITNILPSPQHIKIICTFAQISLVYYKSCLWTNAQAYHVPPKSTVSAVFLGHSPVDLWQYYISSLLDGLERETLLPVLGTIMERSCFHHRSRRCFETVASIWEALI